MRWKGGDEGGTGGEGMRAGHRILFIFTIRHTGEALIIPASTVIYYNKLVLPTNLQYNIYFSNESVI